MAGFEFYDYFDLPGAPERTSAVDSLINAAGGAPLPGIFGVVQALACAWTEPMSGPQPLQVTRKALMSVGIVRAYRRERDPSRLERREDPVDKVIKARGLALVDSLGVLAGLVRRVLNGPGMPEPTQEEVPNTNWMLVTYPCGWVEARFSNEDSDRRPWASYCRPDRLDGVISLVRETMWERSGSCLDLLAISTKGDSGTFDLVPPRLTNDFVDSAEGDEALQMEALADRCSRFMQAGVRRGVLLHGPPGTGKSTLARQLAGAAGAGRVLRLDPVAVSRASQKALNAIIDLLQPTAVVLDDMDRARGAEGLLHYLETANVPIVVGTVNAVGQVDPALLRPGRFDEVHEVSEPGPAWRGRIAEHYIGKFGATMSPLEAVRVTEGFSPADIRELVLVCATVGADLLESESKRIRLQRELYAGDKVDRFLSKNDGPPHMPVAAK